MLRLQDFPRSCGKMSYLSVNVGPVSGPYGPGGCFTNVLRALQNILSKCVYCRNIICDENFKLRLCTCAQNHALGTRAKFQLEILPISVISGVGYFCGIILESSRNVNETTPWPLLLSGLLHCRNWTVLVPKPWHKGIGPIACDNRHSSFSQNTIYIIVWYTGMNTLKTFLFKCH